MGKGAVVYDTKCWNIGHPTIRQGEESSIKTTVKSPDRNAVIDAVKMGVPVIALCDTNNQSNNIDLVIPSNNKGKKSLGLFFWILAREYLRNKGILKKDEELKEKIEDFTEE